MEHKNVTRPHLKKFFFFFLHMRRITSGQTRIKSGRWHSRHGYYHVTIIRIIVNAAVFNFSITFILARLVSLISKKSTTFQNDDEKPNFHHKKNRERDARNNDRNDFSRLVARLNSVVADKGSCRIEIRLCLDLVDIDFTEAYDHQDGYRGQSDNAENLTDQMRYQKTGTPFFDADEK